MSETDIFRVAEYYDGAGRHVTARMPIRSIGTAVISTGEPTLYTGYGRGQMKNPAGEGVNLDYFFDIEADDITRAFAAYDELSKAKWPEVVEQFKKDARKQQSRIHRATTLDKAIIAGGNGRGIKMRR